MFADDYCECDSTHRNSDTVCRWCYEHGRRHWDDDEVIAPHARIVSLPLGPGQMIVGPFDTEREANDFANTWLECVDAPRDQVGIGALYPPSVVRAMLSDVWPAEAKA